MRGVLRKNDMKEMQGVRFLTILCFFVCMMMFSGFWLGCKERAGKEEAAKPSVIGVTVSAVAPSQVDELYETSGTIHSDRVSVIASRVMGAVTSLHVQEGDFVKAGQLLITLDDRDAILRMKAASMALEAARQNMDLTETTWKRYRNLYDQKALSGQEMDQFETQRNVAKAEFERAKAIMEEAKTYLAFTRITSPDAGVVTKKQINMGSMASPGMPLLVIEVVGDAYVEAAIDEGLSSRIRKGMPAEVNIDALEKHFQGTVREVIPDINPASRTFIVKISLPDKDLKSGLYVRVKIPVGMRKAILVSESAIVHKGQLTGVYVVDAKGVITYRLIREGTLVDKSIEVLSGLFPNERIITDGIDKAIDGGVIKAEIRQ
ncbi:MAG: efflux RND transporter periplasmic adaptor subunit [Desulfomonilia bacterium]